MLIITEPELVMRKLADFTIWLIPILIATSLMACNRYGEDCDPQQRPLLTENEKNFIPNQPGDTLHFKDGSGKRFFLVCKTKILTPFTYIPEGHENTPCKSIYQTWDRLTATYEGNLLTDNGNPLFLETRIEGGHDPYDPGIFIPCKSDFKSSFYLFFKLSQPNTFEQVYLGKTDESLFPVMINFNFIPEKTLGGRKYQKINVTSTSNACSSYEPFYLGLGSINSPLGLDSIYYTAQEGLIRLTTIGGQKYQRFF